MAVWWLCVISKVWLKNWLAKYARSPTQNAALLNVVAWAAGSASFLGDSDSHIPKELPTMKAWPTHKCGR